MSETDYRFRETFTTPYDQMSEHEGRTFRVTYVLTEPDEDHDAEVLPMFGVVFDDGARIEAWPEEVLQESAV